MAWESAEVVGVLPTQKEPENSWVPAEEVHSKWDYFKSGLEQSVSGLGLKNITGKPYEAPLKPETFLEKAAETTGTIVGDLPSFAGFSLGAPIFGFATPAVALGGTELVRGKLLQNLLGEEAMPPEQVLSNAGKMGLVGLAMGPLGAIPKLGTAVYPNAAPVRGALTKMAMPLEIGGGATVAAGLEGKSPTAEDVALFSLPVLGLKGTKAVAEKALNVIEAPANARRFKLRQKVAEQAGIPQTATTGKPVQPSVESKMAVSDIAAPSQTIRRREVRDIDKDIQKLKEQEPIVFKYIEEEPKPTQEQPEQKPEQKPESELVVENNLSDDMKVHIAKKVEELGNPEKVRDLYKGDSNVDIFARELAAKKFGLEPTVKQPYVQKMNKAELTDKEFDEVAKQRGVDISTEDRREILSMPPDAQRRWYERALGREPQLTKLDKTAIENAKKAANIVDAALKDKPSRVKNIATLKAAGARDSVLESMSDDEIRRTAENIRNETNPVNPPASEEAAMSELEVQFRNLMKEFEDKDITELTDEDFARYNELANKVAGLSEDEIMQSTVVPDEVLSGKMTYDEYALNKWRTSQPKEQMLDIRTISDEELNRILNEAESTHKLSKLNRAIYNNKADFESHLASNYSMSAEAKRCTDAVVEALRRGAEIDDKSAKRAFVMLYKEMPLTLQAAREWAAKVKELEANLSPKVQAKRNAFSRKAIAKAVANKLITKEEARYIHTVFDSLNYQPTFGFEITKDIGMDRTGVYNLVENLMVVKDAKSVAHEVGHFAFYNVLTPRERLSYVDFLLKEYYNSKGVIDVNKVAYCTTEPLNAVLNPAELFASKFSDYFNYKVIKPEEASLFTRVIDWFKRLRERLVRQGMNIKSEPALEKLFEKISSRCNRTFWSEGVDYAPSEATFDRFTKWTSDFNNLLVWHGSNSIFDRIRLLFAGAGEGSNSRGHGFYTSDALEAGDYYSQVASKRILIKDGETRLPRYLEDMFNDMLGTSDNFDKSYVLNALKREQERLSVQAMEDKSPAIQEKYNDVGKIISFIENAKDLTIGRGKKVLYQIEIPNWLNLLDLDNIVPERQLKAVVEALRSIPNTDRLIEEYSKWKPTGDEVQQDLNALFGNLGADNPKKSTSEFLLNKVGIHGNTYEGEVQGTRNYVIFDEDIPKIKGYTTLNMLGLQSMYERLSTILDISKKARIGLLKGKSILDELKGEDSTKRINPEDRPIYYTNQETIGDVMKWAIGPYIMSPLKFAEGTRLYRHVYNANIADTMVSHIYDIHNTHINEIMSYLLKNNTGVPKSESLKNIRRVIEGKIEGTHAEQEAANMVRNWLEVMRSRYKLYLMNEFKKELNNKEYLALLDLISGEGLDKIKNKYPRLDTETLEDIHKRYSDIDSWGLDDYLPNVERGRYKILASTGNDQHLVAVGLSLKDAERKAVAYLEQHPEVKELYIDTSSKFLQDDRSQVTPAQYGAIVSKLSKQLAADIDVIEKGVAKKLAAKAVARRFRLTPTEVYSPFTQERRDILAGEEDIFPVLRSYAYSIEKKMAFDPVIDRIRRDLKNMTPKEKKYVLDYVEDLKGRYGIADKFIDDLTNAIDAKFRTSIGTYMGYSRAVAKLRSFEANLKLGYRPVAAGVNLVAGQFHSYVKRGAKTYLEALQFLKTEEGKKLIESVEPFLGTSIVDISGNISSKTPVWKPLGLFQKPEPFNRQVSVAAAYLEAKRSGLSDSAAREFAIRSNWAEQFTYNIAALPKIMRGPTGKLITQFKPYLVKEIEFIRSLSGIEWLRYAAMQILLGGPRGYMMIIKTLPILALMPWWQDAMDRLEEAMNKRTPILSRGIAGAPALISPSLGGDISAAATFQFPSDVEDLLGPALSDIYKINKDVLMPLFTYGPYKADLEKLGSVAPIYRHWNRLMSYVFSDDNWVRDEKGNKIYEVQHPLPFIIQSLSGLEPLEMSRERLALSIENRRRAREAGLKERVADAAIDRIIHGKSLDDIQDEIREHGITADGLIRRLKNLELTPRQRAILRSEIRNRLQVSEQFPGMEDFESPTPEYFDEQVE